MALCLSAASSFSSSRRRSRSRWYAGSRRRWLLLGRVAGGRSGRLRARRRRRCWRCGLRWRLRWRGRCGLRRCAHGLTSSGTPCSGGTAGSRGEPKSCVQGAGPGADLRPARPAHGAGCSISCGLAPASEHFRWRPRVRILISASGAALAAHLRIARQHLGVYVGGGGVAMIASEVRSLLPPLAGAARCSTFAACVSGVDRVGGEVGLSPR